MVQFVTINPAHFLYLNIRRGVMMVHQWLVNIVVIQFLWQPQQPLLIGYLFMP